MHAQRLALYLAPRSLLYFRHVIGHMPADAVDIFVPDDLVRDGGDDCPAFRELADAGYRFLPVGQAGGSYGAVGVAGQQDLERCPALAALSARRILLLHASAFVFLPDDAPFTHVLCQYAKQIDLGKPPAAQPDGRPVREIFPAGTYQLGPWEDRRQLPRERLRQLLESISTRPSRRTGSCSCIAAACSTSRGNISTPCASWPPAVPSFSSRFTTTRSMRPWTAWTAST